METPMKQLLDMLQVQNPLRNQMLQKEKDLIKAVYTDAYIESKMGGKCDPEDYINILIYGKL